MHQFKTAILLYLSSMERKNFRKLKKTQLSILSRVVNLPTGRIQLSVKSLLQGDFARSISRGRLPSPWSQKQCLYQQAYEIFLNDNALDLLEFGSNALNLLIITFFLSLYLMRFWIITHCLSFPVGAFVFVRETLTDVQYG